MKYDESPDFKAPLPSGEDFNPHYDGQTAPGSMPSPELDGSVDNVAGVGVTVPLTNTQVESDSHGTVINSNVVETISGVDQTGTGAGKGSVRGPGNPNSGS